MKSVKILIDDVLYKIDTELECNKIKSMYVFYDCLRILLTDSQYNRYITKETHRTFVVSNKKYLKFKEYLTNTSQRIGS